MERKPVNIREAAMGYGTVIGLVWCVKFPLFPLGLRYPLLELLFLAITAVLPFVVYIMTYRFRDRSCPDGFPFRKAFSFTWQLYLYASLLTAVVHFVYFAYIDNGFVISTYESYLDVLGQSPDLKELGDQLMQSLQVYKQLSPIEITMQLLTQNIIYGSLFSLVTALFTMRRKKPESSN